MADWEQAGNNAQHTCFQAETVPATFSVVGSYKFHVSNPGEKLFPPVQAIVSDGHVLVPTLKGNVYSFAAGTNPTAAERAATAVGPPIMGSVAADGTNYYVADTYGRVSAYKLSDGTAATGWTNPVQITDGRPFQCSLLLADGFLMIGGADGVFHAIDPDNGQVAWRYPVGAAVLQTAAWSDASGTGTVVFGAMDLRVYALNSQTGALIWRTGVLSGAAFKDYWPVIVGTRVIVRPMAKYPDANAGGGSPVTPTRGISVTNYQVDASMVTALSNYVASPSSYTKTLYVLDLATGAETPASQVIHWNYMYTMNGASFPGCVDKDGYLVTTAARPATMTRPDKAGWARLNLATGKIVDGLLEGVTEKGHGSQDEAMCASATNTGIFGTHVQEQNAADTGFYRQATNVWQVFGTGNTSTVLYTNTQAAGANPTVISDGYYYHLCHPHGLVVRTAS